MSEQLRLSRYEIIERRKLVVNFADGKKKWHQVAEEIKTLHPEWKITTPNICSDVLWIRKNWPDKQVKAIELNSGSPQIRKLDVACLNTGFISFPYDKWPKYCNYARVKVNIEKLQVEFNPSIKRLKGCKKVIFPNLQDSYRNRISLHKVIAEHIEITRPIIELRDRAGFVIQFYDDDETLLEPFIYWAKHGHSLRNLSALVTHPEWSTPGLTIADHLWPLNAEYALLDWALSKRKNSNSYLDVYPVSRTRKTVLNRSWKLSHPIGSSKCLKVNLDKNRIHIPAVKFFKENLIPSGKWDLVKILSNGGLRFVSADSRQLRVLKPIDSYQPKPQPNIIQSENTFDDWLTEIGYNDDGA